MMHDREMSIVMNKNWCVDNSSDCQEWVDLPIFTPSGGIDRPYRLHRLLTDLEDLVETITDLQEQLQRIMPLVRCFLDSSPWLLFDPLQPDPETGWSVQILYDEPFFPLTVQVVSWAPGMASSIHNHASWGLVALLDGQEKNRLWCRSPQAEQPDRIEPIGELLLESGDIIGFLPEAIHSIEVLSNRPTISFNLYGETNYDQRFEFDPITHQATVF
jgi:predicted metal-dependent enzyme (double-stranded beta helix superfamily)